MKKLLILFLTFLITSLGLKADPKGASQYGMGGCGFGAVLIKENKMLHQLGVTFLNAICGNQTSGITSGTSNCTADGIVHKEKEQEVFVHINYDSLEQEIAVGKGEKLDTLATLFGCSKNKEQFVSMTKKNYSKFFSKNDDPSKLYLSIKTEIQSDKILKNSCQL
jgi:glutamate synthase domain-containing protein 1